MLKIKEVSSSQELRQFIDCQRMVNSADPYWVSPLFIQQKQALSLNKNPFFENNQAAFFIAEQNGKCVGRVAAIENRDYNDYHQDRTGFFGYLEAIDDVNVFKLLLDTAAQWLKEKGCDSIVGPVNPSFHYELGFLVDGFDSPPFIMLSHNPAYYDSLMHQLGYQKKRDFYSYLLESPAFKNHERMERIITSTKKKFPITIRSGNIKNYDAEIDILYDIYNDAMERHWGFSPFSMKEFKHLATELKQILDPDLLLIGEYNHEPVGFLLTVPNFNEVLARIRNGRLFPTGLIKALYYGRKIKGARIITMGLKKKFRTLGVGVLFYGEIQKRLQARNYEKVEMSWVIEDNIPMNKIARAVGGERYKTYRIYEKHL